MKWGIIYSHEARDDLREIYRYFKEEKDNKYYANKLYTQITKAIRSLQELPRRHSAYPEEPWHSKELRYMPVDKYIIFYMVNEQDKDVQIYRIMYSGRNVTEHLG